MRGPLRSRFRDSERGVSAPLGVGLMLVIGLLGTATVIAFGGAALADIENQAQNQRAEQAITMFDSQAAKVALSNPAVQTVSLGDTGDGTYRVNPGAGQISIIQVDCDDDGNEGDTEVAADSEEDDAYILGPTNLGSVVYKNGETTMAYQGGGVWRKNGDGRGVMVSPPEFHYRGATLTLPIIKARGSGDISGTTRAVIRDTSPDSPPVSVFPDASQSFPSYCWQDGTEESFENPAKDGRVLIRIQSEYAKAWGAYFEQRTRGVVTYPSSNTVQLELISLGQLGAFDMPSEGSSVTVSGAQGGHAVPDFSIRIRPDNADSADFANLKWTLYADQGSKQFEIHLRKSGSNGCAGDGTTDISAQMALYYSDDNGNTYHGWYSDAAYQAQCADLDDDPEYEIYFDITFVDNENGDETYGEPHTSDPKLTYGSLSQSQLQHFSPDGTLASPTLDGHDPNWEPTSPTDGSTLTTDQLINHYFAELPDGFQLTVDDKGSDTVNEDASTGNIQTTGSGQYVTYLHVTENEIEIELE